MKRLQLSPDLGLPLDAITQTFGVLAVRGAGKSNLAAVMAEEMFAAGLPFVVVDPVGSWYGLRSSADGKSEGLRIPVFGGRHGDIPLEKTGGTMIADVVVQDRLTCVLDLSEFSEGDKTRFLIDFAERLYRKNTEPLHLFLEEADDYVPQRPFREQARLLRAWENVVRRGRARGLGMTMITQRSAALNKNVLTQIETLFVLRTTSPQDRKAISAWVEYHGQAHELLESLPGLGAGEAWVWSPSWLKLTKRVQIRRRETFDSGATPKDVKGGRPPATLADVDLAKLRVQMADTIEKARAEDPKSLRLRISQLECEVREAKMNPPEAKLERVEVPVFREEDLRPLHHCAKSLEALQKDAGNVLALVVGEIDLFHKRLRDNIGKQPPIATAARPAHTGTAGLRSNKSPAVYSPSNEVKKQEAGLSGPEQRILDAIAWIEALGVETPQQTAVAFLAGYTIGGGAFNNPRGRLNQRGLVKYVGSDGIRLTEEGRALAAAPDAALSPEELQARVLERLPGPEQKILRVLLDAYPKSVGNEELAQQSGYSPDGGAFNNPRGRLRSLGLIEYPERGRVVAKPLLFLESA